MKCGTSIHGIFLSNKREWNIDIYNNMDESQKHYTNWKKPDTKATYYLISIVWLSGKIKTIGIEIRLELNIQTVERENYQPRIIYPGKLSFKYEVVDGRFRKHYAYCIPGHTEIKYKLYNNQPQEWSEE